MKIQFASEDEKRKVLDFIEYIRNLEIYSTGDKRVPATILSLIAGQKIVEPVKKNSSSKLPLPDGFYFLSHAIDMRHYSVGEN